MGNLTQKQHNFVINYVKNGFNGYKAAIDSGYSSQFAERNINRLTSKKEVKALLMEAYKEQELKRHQELCMAIGEKCEVLNRIIRSVVPLDPNKPVDMKYADTAIKAISELNRMSGDYAPDRRLSITVDSTKNKLLEARKQYEEY